MRGRLELRGVRAGYADGPDVLHDVDLVVPAGETHAIVGATGSGKSTLLRLVLRFDDPRAGHVLLDGQDVRDLDWDSLRGSMGYVAQDVFMFAGTRRRQHRLRPRPAPPARRSAPPPRPPPPGTSSRPCPTGSTRSWGSAA